MFLFSRVGHFHWAFTYNQEVSFAHPLVAAPPPLIVGLQRLGLITLPPLNTFTAITNAAMEAESWQVTYQP